MGNHAHIVIDSSGADISRIMHELQLASINNIIYIFINVLYMYKPTYTGRFYAVIL
jgi:hypothetical protein